jgi:hypothetical protein
MTATNASPEFRPNTAIATGYGKLEVVGSGG